MSEPGQDWMATLIAGSEPCPDCGTRGSHRTTCPRWPDYIASKADKTTRAERRSAASAPIETPAKWTSSPREAQALADDVDDNLEDVAEPPAAEPAVAEDESIVDDAVDKASCITIAGADSPVLDLDGIAADIRTTWAATKKHQVEAWEGYLRVGNLLLKARTQLPADQDFGRWFNDQGFAFSQQWAHQLRQLAENESEVRAAVTSALVTGKATGVDAVLRKLRRPDRAEQLAPPATVPPELPADEVLAGVVQKLHNAWRAGSGLTLSAEEVGILAERLSIEPQVVA